MNEPVRLPLLSDVSAHASAPARTSAPELPADGSELMQVGDLAREAGKTVRALHLYEQMDLLRPAARSKGRYRLYGPDALVRIRWIAKLQDLGFSLTDIQSILKDVGAEGTAASAAAAMTKVRGVYEAKLEETRAQIRRLKELEHEIEQSLTYLDTCGTACEPDRLMSACQCCDHHHHEDVPDLVAGFRSRT